MTEVEIVRGDDSHIDALRPLWFALREYHGSVTPDWGPLHSRDDSWSRRRKVYVDVLAEGGVLFLAMDRGEIVGFAICEHGQGESPTWVWPRDYLGVIDILVVEEHRGRGIGAALLAAVEAEGRTRNVAALDLMSAAPNEEARRFYERQGYRLDLVTYRKPLDRG